MKNLVVILMMLGVLAGCKNEPALPDDSPKRLEALVPNQILDSLKRYGMKIYDGENPVNLQGVYNMTPVIVMATAPGDKVVKVGQRIADYRFEFSQQANGKLTIRYKSVPSQDAGITSKSNIYGKGKAFTIISESQGKDQGISYTSLMIISGTQDGSNLRNLQLGFVFKDKGSDPGSKLMPVGQPRIFYDGDQVTSPASGSFRTATPDIADADIQQSLPVRL